LSHDVEIMQQQQQWLTKMLEEARNGDYKQLLQENKEKETIQKATETPKQDTEQIRLKNTEKAIEALQQELHQNIGEYNDFIDAKTEKSWLERFTQWTTGKSKESHLDEEQKSTALPISRNNTAKKDDNSKNNLFSSVHNEEKDNQDEEFQESMSYSEWFDRNKRLFYINEEDKSLEKLEKKVQKMEKAFLKLLEK